MSVTESRTSARISSIADEEGSESVYVSSRAGVILNGGVGEGAEGGGEGGEDFKGEVLGGACQSATQTLIYISYTPRT